MQKKRTWTEWISQKLQQAKIFLYTNRKLGIIGVGIYLVFKVIACTFFGICAI